MIPKAVLDDIDAHQGNHVIYYGGTLYLIGVVDAPECDLDDADLNVEAGWYECVPCVKVELCDWVFAFALFSESVRHFDEVSLAVIDQEKRVLGRRCLSECMDRFTALSRHAKQCEASRVQQFMAFCRFKSGLENEV